ncbi:cytidylyltransferase domain-containing protein [uncultured Draconibacterium sp.]|uniref:cytidylyltransferase domain-containing protein n=1 Tax=uncultured Draconibacterium sp. TaxID=1573823 RepID=UPI0029C83C50|nr:HAD hydrolase family protein [uncultured Draconibacterium sp.]
MKKIAIIPLRAGSKGIPGKNKRKMLGRPLYQWTLGEAIFSNLDEVYVFTDDEAILKQVEAEYSWTPKVKTMYRSPESATDTASTEMAMLELAERINYDFDIICLLQATSPLTDHSDINNTLQKVSVEEYDSALTVVENKRFIWSDKGESLNYDFLARPRRQDFNGMLMENGAVYAATKETFIQNQNRLGGKIGVVHMPDDTLAEIDELSDFTVVSELLKIRLQKLKGKVEQIKYLVFDVDGVFTPGNVAVSPEGELFKLFSIRDGMGLEILRNNGITPVVITSENSPIVARRMEKLQIQHVFLGVKDKFARLNHFCKEQNIKRSQIAYVGDDVNDLCNLCAVGWGLTPNDGLPEVKQVADIVLNNKGGDMAIREAVEFIINQNKRQ